MHGENHLPRMRTTQKEVSQEKTEKREKERRKLKRRRQEKEKEVQRPSSISGSTSAESGCDVCSDSSSVGGQVYLVEGLQLGNKSGRKNGVGGRGGKGATFYDPTKGRHSPSGAIGRGGGKGGGSVPPPRPPKPSPPTQKIADSDDYFLPAIGTTRSPINNINALPSISTLESQSQNPRSIHFTSPPSVKPSPLLPIITGRQDQEGRLNGGYVSDGNSNGLPKLKRGSGL
mmetsp:Transcript_18611/g.25804  ORF Transcript_18611/g.25804 Transcript_18611/m.25804 type:complete len:230 (+) Transcript_18611:594-1283(+)